MHKRPWRLSLEQRKVPFPESDRQSTAGPRVADKWIRSSFVLKRVGDAELNIGSLERVAFQMTVANIGL